MKYYVFLVLTVLFWSGNFIAGRYISNQIEPMELSFYRWFFVLVLLLPFIVIKYKNILNIFKKEYFILIVLGALGVAGFNTFFKRGWKRFYLKWYGDAHPSAERLCPVTTQLVSSIPCIKAAMFAELPSGSHLGKHRDPYAGSVRYHLGLSTPNDERCFIEVDGVRRSWHDGEVIIFDETFVHWAQNDTEQTRIILFCDIERPMKWRWSQKINRWIGGVLMSAAASPNDNNDRTGAINHLFKYVNAIRDAGQKLKKRNRKLYYLIKNGVISLIFVWLAVSVFRWL